MGWRLLSLLAVALAVVAALVPAVQSLPVGAPENAVLRDTQVLSYPVLDLAGNAIGSQAWRVVNGTGNCCENHLLTTPDGRIMDLGGDAIFITSDDGTSWRRATALVQQNGEGSIAYAPNGDIVAIVWDAYSGDRLTAMKLPAGSSTWQAAPVALHTPLYDRPWLGIAQGPFEVGGISYPYASVVSSNFGGAPSYLVSLDGLVYFPEPRPSTTLATTLFNATQPAHDWLDWVQPIGHSRLTTIPSGGILSTAGCPWATFGTDLRWSCVRGSGVSYNVGHIARFDSLGRFHILHIDTANDELRLRTSTNGGPWRTTTIDAPGQVQSADFIVNGQLDQALVALQYAEPGGIDHMLVYRLAGLSGTPSIEVMEVGLGDLAFGGSFGVNSGPRFDFVSIAMLPDGRAVTSFGDSLHRAPTMAIELD